MNVLGIETSCDETAISLIEAGGDFGPEFGFKQLGNALYSQAKLHEQYGGVFPNLAKREHARNLVPLLSQIIPEGGATSFDEADLRELLQREPELFGQLSAFFAIHGKPAVDCIAVTHGPGLEPCLWVGVNFSKALSAAWHIPLVAVNHMEGHIILSLMDGDRLSAFEFPLLALLISGGHTELVVSKEFQQYEIIGKTRDDAAGEAFDKVARLLGLPYPGGPEISRLATQTRTSRTEQKGVALHPDHKEHSYSCKIALPRPMLRDDSLDFSFAGLKTAVRRLIERGGPFSEVSDEERGSIAVEFEDAVADVLVGKTMRALDMFGVNTIVVGGGVSANSYIRERLRTALGHEGDPAKLLVPPPELATDNALMIALAGYFRALKNEFVDPVSLVANGNLKLG